MKKDPLVYIEHILESISRIESFMKDITKEDFIKNPEKQSAVVRQIEIIGEAVKNIPKSFRDKYPNIPWKDIAGMRDKLMHHYFGVDLNTVWKAVVEDIPSLKKQVQEIKQAEKVK